MRFSGVALCAFALVPCLLRAQSPVRTNSGFNTGQLARNDDGSTAAVPIGFTLNFFGNLRSSIYVNNNGNVTFSTPVEEFTPFGLSGAEFEIIAPLFADVDTTNSASSVVTYGQDTIDGRRAFGVNYLNVGYYLSRADKLNRFQLILIERADTGAGNFDIEMNYERVVWETGDASDGVDGLGGTSAAVGWSNGLAGAANRSFQLSGSLVPGSFLDSNPNGLRFRSTGGVPGRLVFQVRNGTIITVLVNPSVVDLSAGQTRQFTADVSGTNNTAVTWSISPQVGTITVNGIYTAPATITASQTVTVTATSAADNTKTGTATINLQSTCSYGFSSASASFDSNGGSGSVNMIAPAGCAWTAVSDNTFVQITSGGTGIGNGTINYSVTANTGGASRSARITSRNQTHTVNQAGRGCFAGLTPGRANVGSPAGMGSVLLTMSSPDCPWIATSNVTWASIAQPTSGVGTATINYNYTTNGVTFSRSGQLIIAGIPFVLTQGGSDCSGVTLSPANQSFPDSGGAGSVQISIPPGCSYTATPAGGFLNITSGGSGNGSGTIAFNVLPNTTAALRTGTITVANQVVTVTQSGPATPAVNCSVSEIANPATLRSTGRTELISPFDVICSGRTGGNVFNGDVVLAMNGAITNRITGATGEITDAILTIEGGGTIAGRLNGPNSLRFLRVPFANGEPVINRRFTISNVRVDVSQLGTPAGATGIPVTGIVTVRAPVRTAILNNLRTLGNSRAAFSIQLGAQRSASTGTIAPVVFQEAFADVFRLQAAEAGPGTADTSTRYRIRVSNVPTGVSIFASVRSESSRARQMSANNDGVGGAAVAGAARAGGTYQQLTIANGVGYVTWETTAADASAIESQSFLMLVEGATQTQINALRFEGALAPVGDVSATATAPIPRFLDASRSLSLVNLRLLSRVQTAGTRPVAMRAPVSLGSTGTFTYTLTNDSDQPATNVMLRNNLPEGLGNASCTSSAGSCSVQAGQVNFNLGTLQPGQSVNATTTAAVGGVGNCPNCVSNGSILENNATAGSDQTDPDLSNNSSETLVDVVAPCSFTLSRTNITGPPGGGQARLDVITGSTCDWTIVNPIAGVSVEPAGPYRGSTTLLLNMSANAATTPRIGIMTVGGLLLRLAQAASGCAASITTSAGILPAAAGNYQAQLAISAGCAWESAAGPDWLRITSATTGAGPTTVNFSAQENASLITRYGFIEIAGETLQVVQRPAVVPGPTCSFTVSPTSLTLNGSGGAGIVNVTTQDGCIWNAASNVSFANITAGAGGTGSGTVTVTAPPNTGAQRGGTLVIANQNVTVTQPTGGGPSAGLRFVALEPCRLMETRAEYNFQGRTGTFGPPFMRANETRTLTVANSNVCSVPATAKAYVLNVTLVPRGAVDFVTLFPGGEPRPDFWSIRSPDGQIVANSAIVKSGNGAIQVYTASDTDIIIDISGYMTDNAAVSNLVYYPLTPCRVVETRGEYRQPPGPFGPPTLGARDTRRVQFPAATQYCQVPQGAAAYSVTMTAVPPGPLAFMTAWPAGGPQPNVSQINSPAGRVLANSVIVPASSNGSIDFFAFDRTDFIVDINGYFAPDDGVNGQFYFPVTQCRAVDSRTAPGTFGGPQFGDEVARTFPLPTSSCGGIPGNARGYVINVTALPGGSPMPFITAYPSGQARPNASILNAFQGQIVTNTAIIPASANGSIDVFAFRRTHVVVDVSGYFGR